MKEGCYVESLNSVGDQRCFVSVQTTDNGIHIQFTENFTLIERKANFCEVKAYKKKEEVKWFGVVRRRWWWSVITVERSEQIFGLKINNHLNLDTPFLDTTFILGTAEQKKCKFYKLDL